ncbi:MAG: hypothetical protein KGQ37_03790 [Hyphomicrobiales bacterium]|nr:hypothetical protein [Hyphomicrobiales bacterium]
MSGEKLKFMVLFLIPGAVMADWAKIDAATREASEARLMAEWQAWMAEHKAMIMTTEAAGKTRRVTAAGASDAKNDIILYSMVEAESLEAAARAFEGHPHLQIPQASIEVMAVRPM